MSCNSSGYSHQGAGCCAKNIVPSYDRAYQWPGAKMDCCDRKVARPVKSRCCDTGWSAPLPACKPLSKCCGTNRTKPYGAASCGYKCCETKSCDYRKPKCCPTPIKRTSCGYRQNIARIAAPKITSSKHNCISTERTTEYIGRLSRSYT